jgi:hypothetical protein
MEGPSQIVEAYINYCAIVEVLVLIDEDIPCTFLSHLQAGRLSVMWCIYAKCIGHTILFLQVEDKMIS